VHLKAELTIKKTAGLTGMLCCAFLLAPTATHAADLPVTTTVSGARLCCVFQRLDGEATSEGLWLTSTGANTMNDRFQVKAIEVGRESEKSASGIRLSGAGNVSVCGQTVRFNRPGLSEEYSSSMDGVRQDFIVDQSPPNSAAGELVVNLAVTGAEVELAADGARLVLENSGRKIAYNRLRVTDAVGKKLPARIEVCQVGDEVTSLKPREDNGNLFGEVSLLTSAPTRAKLALVVNDLDAVYPVRIDPTFSGGNWFPVGSGLNNTAESLLVSGGTLYTGGIFTTAGGNPANCIAQWNGSNWSALGSGMVGGSFQCVYALAVSGSELYAGGYFTNAGGSAANNIAKWNGSNWSALATGITGEEAVVGAMAVSGNTVCAAGDFSGAGTNRVYNIAQWNGMNWSGLPTVYQGGSLGGGFSGGGVGPFGTTVEALVVSGNKLYAGGIFTQAMNTNLEMTPVQNVAQWNGSNWSAIGSGINGPVYALAVYGNTLYAGGQFTTAAGNPATNIAQWNGTNWSALGYGISGQVAVSGGVLGPVVYALAVSGNTLYVGGAFTNAGGIAAANAAQWDGTNWSAVGSGMNGEIFALAVSGSTLYAGGAFSTAGDGSADNIAMINLVPLSIITSNADFGFANGLFGFDLSGPAGYNVVIQASTDMINWTQLQTNQLGSGLLHFSDSQSPANVQRFYRAELMP
jgi:hypothetical protein